MNAIKRHELSHTDIKFIFADIFQPQIHGVIGSVCMFMLNSNEHFWLVLETL